VVTMVDQWGEHEFEGGFWWVFGAGCGGVATAGWSPATEHVRVVVSRSHRPLYSGFVPVGCWKIFILLFFKLKIYETLIKLEPLELDWSLCS